MFRFAPLMVLAFAASACAQPAPQNGEIKLSLSPKAVFNEVALADAGRLLDEQESDAPKTTWSADWHNLWRYPLHATIDLGAEVGVSRVLLYDAEGNGDVIVSTGRPFAWREAFRDGLTNYNAWNEHKLDITTRYLRVSLTSMAAMPEIVVFGEPVKEHNATRHGARNLINAPRIVLRKPSRPTMDEFIGANAFIDDPLERMRVLGWVREYHNWEWDEGDTSAAKYPGYPRNLNAFAPSYAGGGWDFDAYYTNLKNAGVHVVPAIQNSVAWLTPGHEDKPADPTQNVEDPRAYRAHADHMFQFAARYGSRKVPDALLKLAPNQKRVSGLGLLRDFENGNEPDKTWRGRAAYSTPYELAAQCSADYDGHRGALGATYGVKQADPNARLIMAGLAANNLDYLRAMKFWARFNRNGSFPADAINIHHYSAKGDEQQAANAQAVSPEEDDLVGKMRAWVEFRDRELPDQELWVTEFGYDISAGSEQRAPQIGGASATEVQARWLVRSYLALAAAGVDRAAMYMLRDVESSGNTGGRFGTSGLTRAKGDWTPRASWFYVAALKKHLTGMAFSREIATNNPNLRVYEFARAPNRQTPFARAFAVWCPTSNDTQVSNFALPVSGLSATLVTLSDGDPQGVATPLQVANRTVRVNASERPVLVLSK